MAIQQYFYNTEHGQAIADRLFDTVQQRDGISFGVINCGNGGLQTYTHHATLQFTDVPSGTTFDIRHVIEDATSVVADTASETYRAQIVGADLGAQESLVFQQLFDNNAVSAVKLFQLAPKNPGIEVITQPITGTPFGLTTAEVAIINAALATSGTTVYVADSDQTIGSIPPLRPILAVYPNNTPSWITVSPTITLFGGVLDDNGTVNPNQQGSQSFQAVANDDVNIVNGGATEDVVDINVPAPGIPLTFARYYDSSTTGDAALGKGWWGTYDDS